MRNPLVEHMFSALPPITDIGRLRWKYPVFYLVTMNGRRDSNNKLKIKIGF
jgi:hypothetical protein